MGAPGCDDAPLTTVPRGAPKPVTLILPYYDNAAFLEWRVKNEWECWPLDLSHSLSIIVVDDGSPTTVAASVLRRHRLIAPLGRLFRIDVDVRWNWLAARNIGATYAKDGWVMLTDMDHVIPADTLRAVVCGQHDPGIIYRFSRRESDGRKIHPHPNSWLMTREMYWRVGGYDETLSGHYGTDGEYRRRCARTAPIRIMTEELERHEYELDSSTTRYLRKQPEDARGKRMVKSRGPGWKPRVLSFPYHEVQL